MMFQNEDGLRCTQKSLVSFLKRATDRKRLNKRGKVMGVMNNKNIIITGCTSGIGKKLALELDQMNSNLILVARDKVKLDSIYESMLNKENHIRIVIDLEDVENIATMCNSFPKKIDGFVHAAGIESVVPIKNTTYAKLDSIMRLHLYSFIEIIKKIESLKRRDDDYDTSIVVLSSIAAINGGIGQTMYSASKAALEATIKTLSKELRSKRIRLNAVRPGLVDTEMTERWMKRIGIKSKLELDGLQLSGMAKAGEITSLIKFLLSDDSKQIVATSIQIDGGGFVGRIG